MVCILCRGGDEARHQSLVLADFTQLLQPLFRIGENLSLPSGIEAERARLQSFPIDSAVVAVYELRDGQGMSSWGNSRGSLITMVLFKPKQ
jgi:hypothetical protein